MSFMRTVLVIDDNPAVGTALAMLFSLHDITTLTAVSPAARKAIAERMAARLNM